MKVESFLDGRVMLYPGDCLAVLPTLAENSVDSVVCDPPYHLTSIVKRFGGANAAPAQFGKDGAFARASKGFMSKTWDGGDIAFRPETWREVFRVLKPGAYIVAFGGSRTWHRMACAIEDAGFITHPMIAWVFGQGFPKAHSVSKHIDRMEGAEREVVGPNPTYRKDQVDAPSFTLQRNPNLTVPATDAAREWDGWFYGTQSLKPAIEPIYVGQKPFEKGFNGTQNILKWGTGALNIDGCRVGSEERIVQPTGTAIDAAHSRRDMTNFAEWQTKQTEKIVSGRWPANVILEDCEEVVGAFPDVHGAGAASNGTAGANPNNWDGNIFQHGGLGMRHGDEGSAARFFYTAKQNQTETVVITWISELEPCQAVLLVDTGQLLGRATVASASEGDNGWSTFLSGNTITDLFRKASSCTIRMGINSTTQSKTWNWLTTLLTDASIPVVRSGTGNGGSHAASAESGVLSLIITLAKAVYLPGANLAASGTQLKISVRVNEQADQPSVSRIFYGSKAGSDDRLGALHPTVKPLDLMQYLVRLVTPPGGKILDPFAGTGTTGEAAWREGFKAVLIERETEYQADIRRRMALCLSGPDERARESIKAKTKDRQQDHGPLFASPPLAPEVKA